MHQYSPPSQSYSHQRNFHCHSHTRKSHAFTATQKGDIYVVFQWGLTPRTYVTIDGVVSMFTLENCICKIWNFYKKPQTHWLMVIYIGCGYILALVQWNAPEGSLWWCEVVSSKRCRKASANKIKLYVSRNVLFRQFVAFCLVFAGVILSLLRLGHLAIFSA
jgi:hypothetical protein